ncbi:MAG: hypothetical protein LQ343_000395 [Gyalolechia ehrenbergii]|nr:MAG: hypothetical protein LQ343_000395 [Gyalolechia ehrenbergii]
MGLFPIPTKAIAEAVDMMFNKLAAMTSGPKRVLNVNPSATNAGRRVAPAGSSKTDQKTGVRLDQGMPVQGKLGTVAFNLQVNRYAENASLKEFGQKRGTHAVVASVEVDTTQEPSKENLEKLRQAIKDEVHKKAVEEAEAEKKTEKKG